MINCSEAVRRLWEYVEDALDADEEIKVEEHLAFCRRCCGEVDFVQELRTVMQQAAKPHVPDQVAERLGQYLEDLEETPS